MAYGFNEQTSTTSGGQYIDEAGFYEAKLASVAYENAKNDGSGKNILAFRFETADGKSFRHIEWDINEEITRNNAATYFTSAQKEGKPKTDRQGKLLTLPQFQDKSVQDEYEAQGKRIKHVAEAYGGGQGAIQASSYPEFCNKVVASFKGLDTNEHKPLLIIYNSKDYATLPKYTPFFGVEMKVLEGKVHAKPKQYRMEKLERDSDNGHAPAAEGDDEF